MAQFCAARAAVPLVPLTFVSLCAARATVPCRSCRCAACAAEICAAVCRAPSCAAPGVGHARPCAARNSGSCRSVPRILCRCCAARGHVPPATKFVPRCAADSVSQMFRRGLLTRTDLRNGAEMEPCLFRCCSFRGCSAQPSTAAPPPSRYSNGSGKETELAAIPTCQPSQFIF